MRTFAVALPGNASQQLDIVQQAGGSQYTPVVRTYRVIVNNALLRVDFTKIQMDPIINAVEILPSS
jgi:hypothetical protein